jgi:hypothetical protein
MTSLGWSVMNVIGINENRKDVEEEPFDMGQQASNRSLSRTNEIKFENVILWVYT